MSKISLTPNAAGTGTFTIAAPGTNTDRTLTLPDGSGTLVLNGQTDVQTFNSSGTWTKPAFGSMARIQAWGGGGGGARNTSTNSASGGGGGGYNEITVPLSTLASTATVTVGAAGVGRTGSAGVGTAGGTTTFGTLLGASGGGGGILGNSVDPGGPLSADLTTDVSLSGNPFRGGGGTRAASTANNSTYAGAGGAGADTVANTPGGASFLGGSGGAGSRTATAPSGTAPGGGGGGANADFNGGNGGAGRVIVTVW